ncbi:MAG: hypothetical protein DI556_11995 [Rhodovulum sulfidophilum]|uniref:Cell envelope biogenesis protein TolA n=1 Tax=Rhodovulum sulfidophilum TaxID=35806 RepID=A0A2W5N6Y8_RHOSU|nr:MAG: hypothetical protein DI556_11995 [Rhodovulum sulfidophilum]
MIAVVILGLPWFPRRERPPIPVTEVSFVSEADFDRAQSAALAPRDVTAPAEQPRARPATPETPPAPKPEAATPAPEPPAPEPPAPAPEPPTAEPEVTTLAPEFNPDTPLFAPSTAPEIRVAPAPPPTELAAVAPPRARVATTIAPTPTPPAEADVSEEPVPAPAPSPEPVETPTPPAESADAAPEPASETPAPEPEPEPAPLALETAARPVARRGNIETAAAPPAPSTPAPTPPATPARPSDLVEQLREEVERERTRRADATPPTEPSVTAPTPPGEGAAAATSLPSGPPITTAEREGLRLAVQRCWNLPAGLRDAAELKVTLAAELNADGSVIANSVRLVDPSPAPDARFQQAYEAGRRALLRCAPYADLPRDKYAQWRELEVVFNPEGMVSW